MDKTEFPNVITKGRFTKAFVFNPIKNKLLLYTLYWPLNEIKTFHSNPFCPFFYWSNHFLHSAIWVFGFQKGIPSYYGTFKRTYDAGL